MMNSISPGVRVRLFLYLVIPILIALVPAFYARNGVKEIGTGGGTEEYEDEEFHVLLSRKSFARRRREGYFNLMIYIFRERYFSGSIQGISQPLRFLRSSERKQIVLIIKSCLNILFAKKRRWVL